MYTGKKGHFGLTVCVCILYVCVWPLGLLYFWHPWDDKGKGCWEFLWACPHAWLSLTTGNTSCFGSITLWPRALLRCSFSHGWQWHRQREVSDHSHWKPDSDHATDPWHLYLFASVWVSHRVYGHAKCAWVCRDTSLASKTPIRAQSKMPDIHSRAGRWVIGLSFV